MPRARRRGPRAARHDRRRRAHGLAHEARPRDRDRGVEDAAGDVRGDGDARAGRDARGDADAGKLGGAEDALWTHERVHAGVDVLGRSAGGSGVRREDGGDEDWVRRGDAVGDGGGARVRGAGESRFRAVRRTDANVRRTERWVGWIGVFGADRNRVWTRARARGVGADARRSRGIGRVQRRRAFASRHRVHARASVRGEHARVGVESDLTSHGERVAREFTFRWTERRFTRADSGGRRDVRLSV